MQNTCDSNICFQKMDSKYYYLGQWEELLSIYVRVQGSMCLGIALSAMLHVVSMQPGHADTLYHTALMQSLFAKEVKEQKLSPCIKT